MVGDAYGSWHAQDLLSVLSERGASAVEYALMATFIAAVTAAVIAALGGQVLALFCAAVDAIVGPGC